MATHSNTVAWRIPWTEESGGLLCKELDMTEHIDEEEEEEEERNKDLFVCLFFSQVYLLIFWLFLSLSPRNFCAYLHMHSFF